MANWMRERLADPQEKGSIGTTLRQRRWRMFEEQFPDIEQQKVLDLGGTIRHWEAAPRRPASVVVLNYLPQDTELPGMTAIEGDACAPPPVVTTQSFDVVYSNSLIEHVGGHSRRMELASVIDSLAPRHWIQTPYRYFPVEPHWLFPGLQFLPQALRARAIRHWPLSPARPDPRGALQDVMEVELLSKTELQFYFPQSEIIAERIAGITKSLIATR